MRIILIIAFSLALTACATNEQPKAIFAGELQVLEQFESDYVPARDIRIWLPPSYPADAPYDVLYMHDGQNLFDASTTWNNQEWGVDETATRLITTGQTRPFIVVGIDNADNRRHSEYFPKKAFDSLTDSAKQAALAIVREDSGLMLFEDGVQSDNYLKFIVEELKPFVDDRYTVAITPAHTFSIGASMGGLISLYAVSEYPNVFGGAACLSTHWPGTWPSDSNPVPEALFNYFRVNLPEPSTHRIYFDHGDQDLDAFYPPMQEQVDAIMRERGYDERQWLTEQFPGKGHSEDAWRDRLAIPLRFLVGETQ